MKPGTIRILVIDDNIGIHSDFRKVLQGSSNKTPIAEIEAILFEEDPSDTLLDCCQIIVDTAVQGNDGVTMAMKAHNEEPYDVIFVDMRMPPGWNGLRTIQELWARDKNQFVVLCSAYSDISYEQLTSELGNRSNLLLLHKPFEPEEVLQIVCSVYANVTEESRADRKLAWKLKQGIAGSEFEVAYQPIVDLESGELWAFECLARWFRDGRSVANPDEFVRVAEVSGLISEFGRLMLRQVMEASVRFQGLYPSNPPRLTVNISPIQICEEFVQDIKSLLLDSGADPCLMSLEVTESRLLDDRQVTFDVLADLKQMGFEILLDDFGSGFSNLLGLTHLPFDGVKVDRQFCASLNENPATSHIIKSVIELAGGLGKSCVIEGVETAEDQRIIRDLGGRFVQGYLYAKPMPFSQTAEWLEGRQDAANPIAA